jgi:hypothetical protein
VLRDEACGAAGNEEGVVLAEQLLEALEERARGDDVAGRIGQRDGLGHGGSWGGRDWKREEERKRKRRAVRARTRPSPR